MGDHNSPRYTKFLLDLPIFDLHPFKKPVFHGFMTRLKTKLFGKDLVARGGFIYNTYVSKPGYRLFRAGAYVFLLCYLVRVAPPIHNWRLEKAYQDRYDRHVKYMGENPKYTKALLHAYGQLAPPQ